MERSLLLRNADIKRVLVGVPEDHSHIRAVIETIDGEQVIVHEATLAAIVRAYTSIKTSPTLNAVELVCRQLAERKRGYAEYQLLESGKSEPNVQAEIDAALSQW